MTEEAEETWNSYTELIKILNEYILIGGKDKPVIDFESVLRRYKQNFFTILQNPPKNPKCRKDLEKGMVDGITVRGIGHQVLSKELYQEAIIISDMYDMNEYMALDLLCTAQLQMSFYPGLPRGLVAIILYYTARKNLACALRLLINARAGVLWRMQDIRSDVEKFIMEFTNELLKNGVITRLLDLLKTLDLTKEVELLQQNAALGDPKHRKQVINLFSEIRLVLAETVFLWSANCGLTKDCAIAVINYLRDAKLDEEASGKLSNVNMFVLTALLYTIDLSILRVREDGEEVVQSLPIISDPNYVETLLKELAFSSSAWRIDGLKSVAMFALGVCMACLRDLPQTQQKSIDQEDDIIEKAIEAKVFDFLNNTILDNELIATEEFVVKRFHNLITDFICSKYSKVKEMRVQADEAARTIQVYTNEGLEPPANLPRHFEQFLLVISRLYENNSMDLNLAMHYWSPLEIKSNQTTFHLMPAKSAHSLFKFIRLAGDLLPPTLFVPYLKMLGSLAGTQQSARYCFNMLKSTSSGTMSWDHFFLTFNRYYSSLHQETPGGGGTVYRRPNLFHKGITPQEIEGLQAVLYVVRKVANNDDFSRLALCEHPGWAPLNVLLGLVSCSVPVPLKADLLLTLASLAKSPEIATQLWETLEASQILVTVPSTSSYQPRGIQTELDEIESHVEEYPLSTAFLVLLDVLTDAGIPRTLGAGPRVPGFDPYLHFIVSSVFLKFLSRPYKNQEEKWKVASVCLKLLEKFLLRYEPSVSDFPVQEKTASFNSPPGYHLMLQLNTKSDLLNLLMFIVDEGCRLFSQYAPFLGKKFLEDCTLRCLNIFERALVLQPKFFSVLSTNTAPKLLAGLSKLLLTINPRTGKPDCCVTVAKYTGFQDSLPKHALAAVKLLIHITDSPILHSQFTNILFVSDDVSLIKNNFVECLETNTSDEDVYIETKEKILQLLQQCLPYAAPNLTHFFLGFDLNRDISKMQFQYPGVLQFPRTCLHSLLGILKSNFVVPAITTKSSLLEAAYRVLYLLVADGKTSEPVLKLLRMDQKFFREHLEFCSGKMNQGTSDLNQLSWLLQTVAVEVKVTCQQNQLFYLKQLTNLLVDMPPDEIDRNVDIFDFAPPQTVATYDDDHSYMYTRDKVDSLLVRLISHFDFNVTPVEEPRYDYFDLKVLEGILQQCEIDEKPKLIDVKRLHQILIDELNNLQGNVAVGQRQAILEEIQKVLVYAVSLNELKKTRHSIVCFVNGWSEVVEILVSCLPIETLSLREQQTVDIQLLEALLNKALKMELLPEIAAVLSSTTMTLLANLRYTYQRELKYTEITSPTVIESKKNQITAILKHLIQWLMHTGVADQMIRAHLYSALIYILHLVSSKIGQKQNVFLQNATYVNRLDTSRIPENSNKQLMNTVFNVLSEFGEKFVETVAQDCVGSHNVCKLLAMSVFSLLIDVNGMINWIVFVSGKGYLRHMMESVFKSDEDFIGLLDPSETDSRCLFIYESRMALLSRIATARVGAELLLEQKLLSYLGNMKIFNHHPEIGSHYGEDDAESLTIPVSVRFIRIWLPTFHVCNSILTSLGTDNQSAVTQITHYILNQSNVVELVLRAGHPSLSKWALKELAALTSVIARTAHNDLLGVLDNEIESQNIRTLLFRVQKLMLSLLPKFVLNNTVIKEALKDSDSSFKTSKRLVLTMQIISNLLLYCRNIVANHGIDHGAVGVIFQPSLKDSNFDTHRFSDYNPQNPSLKVLLEHLIHTVRYQQQERHTLNFLKKHYDDVPKMNSAELKECLKEVEEFTNLRLAREHAMLVFTEKLQSKQQEMEHCAFVIEHCLYIVWTHVDYFMLKAIPKAKNLGLLNLSQIINFDTTLASASEATWKVTTDDISALKQCLVSILNDSFCKQLMDTAEDRPNADKELLETLLRKIKRLVQFAPVK